MLEIALVLAEHDRAYEDIATKFFEHFAYIADRAERAGAVGRGGRLLLRRAARRRRHAGAAEGRSVVGLLPLAATTVLEDAVTRRLPDFAAGCAGSSQQARVRRGRRAPAGSRRRPAAAAAVDGRAEPAAAHPRADARRGRVPVPLRPPTLSRAPPRAAVPVTLGGRRVHASTTSRPSRPAGCSAATRTGAGRSGSRSTTC